MFFSVGVETPKDDKTAYGMIVPALFAYDHACFSAADTQEDIAPMVKEAILLVVEELVMNDKVAVENIKDAGYLVYAANPEYKDFDSWVMIDVDLSELQGKPQRINISLPDTLIKRIDSAVKSSSTYRDRSHFLAEAARHELSH